MRRLIWQKQVVKQVKKLIRQKPFLKPKIENTLSQLVDSPFAPSLNTHKLKGGLKACWSCTVDFETRIVFRFVPSEESDEDDILLLAIRDHDTIY